MTTSSDNGLSPTVDSCSGGNRMPKVVECNEVSFNHSELPCVLDDRDKGYGVKTSDCCPTQRANRYGIKLIESDYRIRKLTPKECWKLMGLTFEDCDKAHSIGVADSHLYKQAGNGIVTNCCKLLAEHLYKAQYDNSYVCTDENFIKPQSD